MKKRFILLLGLGLTFIIVPFLFNTYSILRLLSVALGTLMCLFSFSFHKNNVLIRIILLIILLGGAFSVDLLLVSKYTRVPIFARNIESSENVKTYNSFFYRVYDCNGKKTFDKGYKLSYVCDLNDLKEINIVDLLSDPKKGYNEYKEKFVNVLGKISKITGKESIELALYSKNENSLNGNVSFNLNYNLQINTNEDLSKYRIYDYINVYGRVSEIKKTEQGYTLVLKDTLLVPCDLYNEYSYEIVNSDTKALTNLVSDKDYYYYGISSLNIKYDSDNIYELSYLLTDNRFTWNDLIKSSSYETLKDDEEQEIAKYYTLDKFNLLDCHNGKKIVINKNYKVNKDICDLNLE